MQDCFIFLIKINESFSLLFPNPNCNPILFSVQIINLFSDFIIYSSIVELFLMGHYTTAFSLYLY